MDLSKLPKLSQTQQAAPADSNDASASTPAPQTPHCLQCGLPLRAGAKFCDACGAVVRRADAGGGGLGNGADAWLSIALGVILLIMSPRLIQYVLSPTTFPTKWSISDETGAPMPYTKSVFFWGDIAIVSFALVLIVEGIVFAFGRRAAVVSMAFGLTCAATLLNLIYVIVMIQKGYGAQIFSILAVAFGVYIAMQQYISLKMVRR